MSHIPDSETKSAESDDGWVQVQLSPDTSKKTSKRQPKRQPKPQPKSQPKRQPKKLSKREKQLLALDSDPRFQHRALLVRQQPSYNDSDDIDNFIIKQEKIDLKKCYMIIKKEIINES